MITTRVLKRNVDNWKKLRRCILCLNKTVENVRIVGGYNLTYWFIWVDASYAVHTNMRSQAVGVMSMGYGMLY